MKTLILGILMCFFTFGKPDLQPIYVSGIVVAVIGLVMIIGKIANHNYQGRSIGSNIGEIFAELAVDSIDFGSGGGGGDGGGGGGYGGGDGGGGGGDGGG